MQGIYDFVFFLIVQFILLVVFYLVREYWYDPYDGIWGCLVPYAIMVYCLFGGFVLSLFSLRILAHGILDFAVYVCQLHSI